MISGYTSAAAADAAGVYVLKTADETKPAAYMGPAPPAENPPYAHNYIELLYLQPAGWAPPASLGNRFGITDAEKYLDGLKFGAPPVAANFFNVTG
jgi:phosphatidylethanolamine-binding protein